MERAAAATEHRVPCPACGGYIHPIASRCKHCKVDIGATKQSRRAAPLAQLPSLEAVQTFAPLAASDQESRWSKSPSPAAPFARDNIASQAVSLPTFSEELEGSGTSSKTKWWKRWPVFVIAVAVAAIVYCAYLLLTPTASSQTKRITAPPPVEMNTTPTPSPTPPPVPSAPGGSPAAPTPSLPDPWGANPFDPYSDPDGVPDDDLLPKPSTGQTQTQFAASVATKLCAKLSKCSGLPPDSCEMIATVLQSSADPSNCNVKQPAAAKCMRSIDQIRCDAGVSALPNLMQDLRACSEAFSC
jgi:hypothetical protein